MICSPKYEHDISFWILDGKNEVNKTIFDVVKKESKQSVINVDLIDEYFNDQKELFSQTYRLTYYNETKIINPSVVMELHYSIGEALTRHLNIQIR